MTIVNSSTDRGSSPSTGDTGGGSVSLVRVQASLRRVRVGGVQEEKNFQTYEMIGRC